MEILLLSYSQALFYTSTFLMRVFYIFLFVLCQSFASAQYADLEKTWISDSLDFVKIDSQFVDLQVFGKYSVEKRYHRMNDTLQLFDVYTTSRDHFTREYIKNYNFLIRRLTGSDFTLVALDSQALEISGNKKALVLKERYLNRNTGIKFKMIKFHSTFCLGECPTESIQINNDRKMVFVGGPYAIKQGCYSATVPDSLYNQLIEILEISDLDFLKTWEQTVYDAPEYTLEVYYNGKIKYLKNFELPSVTQELIEFLLGIPKKVELRDPQGPCKIEVTAPYQSR